MFALTVLALAACSGALTPAHTLNHACFPSLLILNTVFIYILPPDPVFCRCSGLLCLYLVDGPTRFEAPKEGIST